MTGKLGAVIEGDGLPQLLGKRAEQLGEMVSDKLRGFAGKADRQQQTGLAFMDGQDRLAVFGKHHQVGFPVARGAPVTDDGRPFSQANTAFDEGYRAAALAGTAPPLALAVRQIVAPAIVLGAFDLGIKEAVDALVGDHLASVIFGQPAGDLLWRPAHRKTLEHSAAQGGLPGQARAHPAPLLRSLLSISRLVSDPTTAIALQLPSNR
jgi:hypothetical protein